jgi:catechol 2,3-dioxygenase-like lactoylglutathione lyase family enzyme
VNVSSLRELWGPPGQIGYIVNELETAAQKWTDTIGIGPWRIFEHAPFDSFDYNGEPSDVDVGIALAFSGDVQIELIQQHNAAPSMYRELLDTYGEGAQHICFYPDDYNAAVAAATDAGMSIGQEGVIWGVQFAYLRGDAGRIIELAQLPDEMRTGRQRGIDEAASWDGTNPIRRR